MDKFELLKPEFTQYLPFAGLAMQRPSNQTPFVTRLLEAFIIGGVVLYGTVQVLGERIDSLARTQMEIKRDIQEIRRDFYAPRLPGNG